MKSNTELDLAFKLLKENQEKLLVSEKMASLGKLTSGIAHEMNTPLAASRSSLTQLADLVYEYKNSVYKPEVLPEDHIEIAVEMSKCITIALSAIEKCVGFIKGIKGHIPDYGNAKMEIFELSPVIRDSLMILEFALHKKSCTLNSDMDENVKIKGSPKYISQIITNLIINSLEACKVNGGLINLNLKKNDGMAVLKISDNGCGITPENMSRIFDPLFSTKPFGEGAGLGLSIVHDLISQLNGSIDVKSDVGATEFTVAIPLAE
jgi:C4-dicarboxylate-specific signal transduction histidine kinase